MTVELRLNDIGEGMQEGEIVRWLVQEGDRVDEDQPVVEVQTDKVVAEIPAPASGVVDKICTHAGTVVPVGELMLLIRPEKENTSTEGNGQKQQEAVDINGHTEETEEKRRATDVPHNTPVHFSNDRRRINGGRALAAPATRRLARKLGVDIERITGSGPGGRVLEQDVRNASELARNGERDTLPAVDGRGGVSRTRETDGDKRDPEHKTLENMKRNYNESYSAEMPLPDSQGVMEQPEKLNFTGLRGVVAKNMVQSAFTIPHVTHFDEIDVTELIRIRRHVKNKVATRGIKLTFLPFFIKAIVVALQEFPVFNATWSEDGHDVWLQKNYHIGVAVDTEDGLVVPVIKHADQKNIMAMAMEIEALANKARERRLTRDDLTGGTFTVSNVGSVGGLFATPIIRYPEVALMAFHKIKARPVVVEEDGERRVAIRDIMNVSLSFDHRVADGVAVVRFTNRMIELLESPEELLIELA